MGRLRDTLALFMALSPLQEAIIRATVNNSRLIELKHRLSMRRVALWHCAPDGFWLCAIQ